MNKNMNCLYNVYLRDGLTRMRESEIIARFGRGALDEHYADHIDHSEWCECRDKAVMTDPFLAAGPPF